LRIEFEILSPELLGEPDKKKGCPEIIPAASLSILLFNLKRKGCCYLAKKLFTSSFGIISSWKMYAPVLGDFTILMTFE
jgi:hypothetical protein